jgi:hypothetical protein
MSESALQFFAVPGPVFEARYRGKCWRCGRRFPAGERIRYIAKNTVAHEECAVASRPINDPVLSDERARENMRSHKPSSWRRGRSPASYG